MQDDNKIAVNFLYAIGPADANGEKQYYTNHIEMRKDFPIQWDCWNPGNPPLAERFLKEAAFALMFTADGYRRPLGECTVIAWVQCGWYGVPFPPERLDSIADWFDDDEPVGDN